MTDLNRSSLVKIAHVHGADAWALTTGHLRSLGIPVFSDIAHFGTLHPQWHTALGGIAISVSRSDAPAALEALESTTWVSRPLSNLSKVMWVAIVVWAFVPPLASAVFLPRALASTKVLKQPAL